MILNLNEEHTRSKLANNILKHFIKYIEENNIINEITLTDEVPITSKKLRVDFAFLNTNPKIFIEVDGIQHKKSVKHWGGELGLDSRKNNDTIKEQALFIKYPDSILIRFNEKYINYNEFLKIINEHQLKEILLKGDVSSGDDIVIKKKKKKSKKLIV